MKDLENEYLNLKKEIAEYLSFIKKANKDGVALHYKSRSSPVDDSTKKVLKATFLLLLYNLVEAIVTRSVTKIYDSVKEEGVGYQDLAEEIQKVWIQTNLKDVLNYNDKSFLSTLHEHIEISVSNKEIELSKEFVKKLISGNLDSSNIRKICLTYGILIAWDSKHLDDVKNKRNQLAHGEFSFSEIGRTYSVEDLDEIFKSVVTHLNLVLKEIKKYILSKKFKKPSPLKANRS